MNLFIVSGSKIVDGIGSHQQSEKLLDQIAGMGMSVHSLYIEPLQADWFAEEKQIISAVDVVPLKR